MTGLPIALDTNAASRRFPPPRGGRSDADELRCHLTFSGVMPSALAKSRTVRVGACVPTHTSAVPSARKYAVAFIGSIWRVVHGIVLYSRVTDLGRARQRGGRVTCRLTDYDHALMSRASPKKVRNPVGRYGIAGNPRRAT